MHYGFVGFEFKSIVKQQSDSKVINRSMQKVVKIAKYCDMDGVMQYRGRCGNSFHFLYLPSITYFCNMLLRFLLFDNN